MTDRRIEDAEAIARGEAELPIGKLLDQHHREVRAKWRTNDGCMMRPSEMETDHVENALAFLRSREPRNEGHLDYLVHWIARFESELAWRRDGYGTDLRALLAEVVEELCTPVALLDKDPLDVAREQADRLRLHVDEKDRVAFYDYGTEQQRLERIARQIVQIIDAEAWCAIDAWLKDARECLGTIETAR
jgi:hypothetical protein